MQKTIALADFAEALSLPLSYAIAIVDQLRELERRKGSLDGITDEYMARHLEEPPRKFKGKNIVDLYRQFEKGHKGEIRSEINRRNYLRRKSDQIQTEIQTDFRSDSDITMSDKEKESDSPLMSPSPPVTPVTPIIPFSREKETPARARKTFSKPTVDEVRAYCLERRNNVDPQTFVDFYEAKGWVVGKSPMRDWKAAVRTWEKRHSGERTTFQPSQRRDLQPSYFSNDDDD